MSEVSTQISWYLVAKCCEFQVWPSQTHLFQQPANGYHGGFLHGSTSTACLTSHADRERFALWTSARKVLPLLGGKEIQSQSFSDLHFAVIGETARIGVRLSFSPLFGV